ncbi:hypothetical protein [Rhodococcus aetherivorans]|uniref:hypothetical protein n=1 Tax=Rhodococcus aetherivorans TaxID=191292 RepID=UPI0002D215C9|nr:hypothetical protein [Rhodococcus aetherivorans]CCW14599.1 Phage minor tail protein \
MPRKRTEALVQVETFRGEWFTISGPGQGDRGVELSTKVEDLYDVPVETIRNSHAFQKGSSYGGKRIKHRIPVFGVDIVGENGSEWELLDSEWAKGWDYDNESKLWIETESSRRCLSLSLFEQPKVDLEFDPHGELYAQVTMTCVAGDPYWYEPDDTAVWVSTTDTTGGGTASGDVTVHNPTNQEIWLKWVLQAYPGAIYSLPDFSFGDDREERAVIDANRIIQMPALIAGEHLLVDSDPDTTQVESNIDTAVYLRMGGVRFAYPIPPYTPPTSLPVSVTKAPAGVGVQVRMPRPWSRPWGLQ